MTTFENLDRYVSKILANKFSNVKNECKESILSLLNSDNTGWRSKFINELRQTPYGKNKFLILRSDDNVKQYGPDDTESFIMTNVHTKSYINIPNKMYTEFIDQILEEINEDESWSLKAGYVDGTKILDKQNGDSSYCIYYDFSSLYPKIE